MADTALIAASPSTCIQKTTYALQTFQLFTFSDWKAIIVPQTLLALVNARSGRFTAHSQLPSPAESCCWTDAIRNLPTVISWLWLTTLVQDVANQRLPGSIQGDTINKPWRPLPSKRISANAASGLLFYAILVAVIWSAYLGDMVLKACAVLICIVYLYNDLDGSNSNSFMRNALIACGHVAYGVGATATATGAEGLSEEAVTWFIVIWLAIFTTSHGQDFADKEGDRARGRATMPLIFGEVAARLLLAAFALIWSFAVPMFWGSSWSHHALQAILVKTLLLASGVGMAIAAIADNSRKSNKRLLKLWCVWVAAVFMTPLVAN